MCSWIGVSFLNVLYCVHISAHLKSQTHISSSSISNGSTLLARAPVFWYRISTLKYTGCILKLSALFMFIFHSFGKRWNAAGIFGWSSIRSDVLRVTFHHLLVIGTVGRLPHIMGGEVCAYFLWDLHDTYRLWHIRASSVVVWGILISLSCSGPISTICNYFIWSASLMA